MQVMDLNKLCRRGTKELGWTTKPFNILWNNVMWTVATDGYGMVIIKADSECVETSEAVTSAVTSKVIPILDAAIKYDRIHEVLLSDLKQFLGEPVWDCEKCIEVTMCIVCEGSGGESCDSCKQEVTCEKCHGSGKAPCRACNDRGYIGKGDAHRSGVVYGVAVNLNLLARYLSVVDGESVQARTGKKLEPFLVTGVDWMVLLMPLDRALTDMPVYPGKIL